MSERERLGLAGGFEKNQVILRVVFQIGVLDDDELALRRGDTLFDRVALAHVSLLQNRADARLLGELLDPLASAVGGTVVDEDDLLGHIHRANPGDDLVDGRYLIVSGNHHAQFHVGSLP